MPISAHITISSARRFFLQPRNARQRQYEALRAYFVEQRPSAQVARAFGYTPGSFSVLCSMFRHGRAPDFFAAPRPGPRQQPKKSAARTAIVTLRKQNYSVYDIAHTLREEEIAQLSPTAIREVLKEEGFAPLPRRLDEERPAGPRPSVEPVADARQFSLEPFSFHTKVGGLFLLLPDLIAHHPDRLAAAAELPGSKMIPAGHALRCCLALKLWSIERKSRVMSLVADQGLALFAGLNAFPKKSYLSEYSSRFDHNGTLRLLKAWYGQMAGDGLFDSDSFNLDFHSVRYYGVHPLLENHYVSARSRAQPSVLVFLAQDAGGRAFCYSNADLRKGEEPDEILRFIDFWKRTHGKLPGHLVFDSKLTTYANLARIDQMGISFITLRRRNAKLRQEVEALPASAWRVVELDVPARKFKTPRVFEQPVRLAATSFRQLFVDDLGHDQPTILLSNESNISAARLITRYAQRMLIENALSDAVRFFHMDALSSAVHLKVDFDMALLVIASGLYRLLARRMRGYADAQARQVFRDLIDMPAHVAISPREILVHFDRRAHLPIIRASGLLDVPVKVPWWNQRPLRLMA
ncbi:MAG: hypothetical protein AB1726_18670 [Planctomycetota bacterium]